MKGIPFLLFGRDWWERVVNWTMLAEAGVISAADLDLFRHGRDGGRGGGRHRRLAARGVRPRGPAPDPGIFQDR
jgi:hypothetical protein